MPTLADYPSSIITKLMLLGDSGTGKTGALVSLVEAGYNLYIADFDRGLDIVRNVLLSKPNAKELLARVNYEQFNDEYKNINGRLVPVKASAWPNLSKVLSDWPGVGNVEKLGPKDVLCIDSLTFAGRAAVNYICSLNGRLGQKPYQSDYGDAQVLVANLMDMLHSSAIKCNVVVITHIREMGKYYSKEGVNNKGEPITLQFEEEGTRKGYPETGTGKALSPALGRFFNSVLLVESTGAGTATKRFIYTQPQGNIGVKATAVGTLPLRYPIETGLAQYFAAVRGETVG